MLGDLYQGDVDQALGAMSNGPATPKLPESDRSAWGAPWRAAVGGVAQGLGSMADVLKGFGAASAMALEADPIARAAVGERAVREGAAEGRRLIDSGEALTSEGVGRSLRNVERDLRPDPATASTAEQIVYGVVRPVSKLIAGGLVAGPFGIAGAAAEEGFSQADDLRERGVDLGTRTQIGALTAGVTAAGAFLPMAGPTLKATAGLYLAGGPGAFMAQQAISSTILQHAGYDKIAAEFDPLDPIGLLLSSLIPLPFAVHGVVRNVRAARAGKTGEALPAAHAGPEAGAEPPTPHVPHEAVDAAMAHNLTARADVHDAVPPRAADFLVRTREIEPTPGAKPFDAAYLDDDFNVNQDARAYTMRTVDAVDEAMHLVGERRFEELAAPRAAAREADTLVYDPAARVEMVARKIVDFYEKNPPEPPSAAVPRPEPVAPARAADVEALKGEVRQARAAVAGLTKDQLTGTELAAKDRTEPHLKAVAERVQSMEKEAPQTPVRAQEDGKHVSAVQELERVRREAAEGTDNELGTLDADLLRVAAECAISLGSV